MLDPATLADLGGAALAAVWLPVAAWTVLALAAEGALRLSRAEAAVGLPVRGAVLAALPLSVALPAALGAWAPATAVALTAFAPPAVSWLPEVVVGGGAAEPVAASAPPPSLVALGVLTALVAAVGGAALVRLAGGAVRLGRVRRSLPAAPPETTAAVERARERLGVRRPVGARSAPAGVAPFTVGWRRPVVAVPADLGGAALDVALAHELAHVRRADFAWHAAQRVLASAFAAHPLVWALGRGLDLDRERAADAAVLAAWPGKRRTYADLLLRYASLPAPPFALGAGRGDFSLKTRIDAMTRPLSPDRARRLARHGRLAGLLTLALAAGLAATTAPGLSSSDDFSWSLDRLAVDGTEYTVSNSFTSLEAPRFDNLVLLAEPHGTFTIADRPFDGAARAGRFEGRRLAFEVGGRSVVVDSETPYFETGRAAYVRLDAPATAWPRRTHRAAFLLATSLDRPAVPGRAEEMFAPLTPGITTEGYPSAPPDTTDEVYEVAEVQPELIGGLAGIQERLEYPELQYRAGVEGTAVLQFVVSKQGEVTDLSVIRSSGNDGLDRAAAEAVQGARFRPGRQRGEPVRVRFAVPVTFRLGGDDDRPARGVPLGRPLPPPQTTPDGTPIYEVAEVQPELIGGLAGLQEDIVYPADARAEGVEGQVVVQFVVDEEGGVVDPVVLRSPDDRLAEAALAAVRQARFRPGQQRGEPVRVRFAVPITFRLPADQGQR